jgi:hypothetical protein
VQKKMGNSHFKPLLSLISRLKKIARHGCCEYRQDIALFEHFCGYLLKAPPLHICLGQKIEDSTKDSLAKPRPTPYLRAFIHCSGGGIGRRARLRIWWDFFLWGFESPLEHHSSLEE